MTPEFPLRIIFDDGEALEMASPEELLETVDAIDSADIRHRVWIRDASGRTVRLRVTGGSIELFELA